MEMTKPANFPERKRQRQIRALQRLSNNTAGHPARGSKPFAAPKSNDAERLALFAATEFIKRNLKTKKVRA